MAIARSTSLLADTLLSGAQATLPHWLSVSLEFAPHVDFIEVIHAYPHRQRLQAVLDKPATSVQRKRCIVAGGDGQLDDFEARMLARFIQRRFHQPSAQALLLISLGHVHPKQGHFVPRLLPKLERQADDASQFIP